MLLCANNAKKFTLQNEEYWDDCLDAVCERKVSDWLYAREILFDMFIKYVELFIAERKRSDTGGRKRPLLYLKPPEETETGLGDATEDLAGHLSDKKIARASKSSKMRFRGARYAALTIVVSAMAVI